MYETDEGGMALFLLDVSFILLACGGGGGGGGDDSAGDHTPAGIDQSTSRSALSIITAMSASSGDLTEISGGIVPRQGLAQDPVQLSQPPVSTILRILRQKVLSASPSLRTGDDSATGSCSASGSMTVDLDWDGPDDPIDCTQISNLRGTIQAQNCSEQAALVMDGTFAFRFDGSLCQPTAIWMRFADFSLSDNSGQLHMNAFTIDMNDLQWAGGAVVHQTLVFNGDIQGNSLEQDFRARFSDYTMAMATGGSADLSLRISGALTGSCLDGWVTVETAVPLQMNMDAGCPTAGQITLSGIGTMAVSFNADGSVDIGDAHYPSCDEVTVDCI